MCVIDMETFCAYHWVSPKGSVTLNVLPQVNAVALTFLLPLLVVLYVRMNPLVGNTRTSDDTNENI